VAHGGLLEAALKDRQAGWLAGWRRAGGTTAVARLHAMLSPLLQSCASPAPTDLPSACHQMHLCPRPARPPPASQCSCLQNGSDVTIVGSSFYKNRAGVAGGALRVQVGGWVLA